MSRRAKHFRKFRGSNPGETASNILSSTGKATRGKCLKGKKLGRVCSLPMNPEKAQRIAQTIHKIKRKY